MIGLQYIELGTHLIADSRITLLIAIGIKAFLQFTDVGQHKVVVRPYVRGSDLGVAPGLGGQGAEFRLGIPDLVLQIELLVHTLLQGTDHAIKQGLDGRSRRRERVLVHLFEVLGARGES